MGLSKKSVFVMLSKAKHLLVNGETLRFTQGDSLLSFSLDPVFHIFTGNKEIFGTLTGLGPIKSLHR
jgi:hypothetical protein